MRWLLAMILIVAAGVNAYLAVAEAVVWPAVLALVWIGIAAALIMPHRTTEVPHGEASPPQVAA